MKGVFLGIASAAILAAGNAEAATAARTAFGALSDGTKIEAVTLTNDLGACASRRGAVEVRAPARHDRSRRRAPDRARARAATRAPPRGAAQGAR